MMRVFVVGERYAITDEFIRAQNAAPGRWKVDYVPCTEPQRLTADGARVYMIEPMHNPVKRAEFDQLFKRLGCTVRSVDVDQVVHH